MKTFWKIYLALMALGFFIFVSTQLWWTETGYCIGSFLECNV